MAALTDKWERVFAVFFKIGADKHSLYSKEVKALFMDLTTPEKQLIGLNFTAFIFGPFYYFYKKMWLKGCLIFGGAWILNSFLLLIADAVDLIIPYYVFFFVPASLFSVFANYDYFKFVTKKEEAWDWLPKIFSKEIFFTSFSFFIAPFVFFYLSALLNPPVPKCDSSEAINLVIKIAKAEAAKKSSKHVVDSFTFLVSAIEQKSINEKRDTYQCSGELSLLGVKIDAIPITYTVNRPKDSDQFFVKVFGL